MFRPFLQRGLNYNTIFDVHRAVHRNIISIAKPTRCTNVSNLFYFWNDILHVSDGLSVHHQEFETVHTATGICQTDTPQYEGGALTFRQRSLSGRKFNIYSF